MKVSKIIFPNKPHLDPIAAYWLLLNYGAEKFPGIKEASLAVWKAGHSPSSETLKQWQEEGVISFDIEGGTYDHHGTQKCTALLIAEDLGIKENPELQALLRYVQEDDMAGLHNNFGDLAGVIKAFYKKEEETEEVIKFTLKIIDALQAKEKSWAVDAKKEFEEKAKVFKIKRGKNKIKLAVIKSDNLDVSNYGRQKENVAVLIQQNSKGFVYIFTNAFNKLNIKDIVAVIRLREAELNNKPLRHKRDLRSPGKITEVQNWFFHDALNAMMNGSAALAETPPTKIPLEEIVGIVVFGLASVSDDDEQNPQYQYYQSLFNKVK